MGITGLLPFLKNATKPAHVSEFKGSTAGIDVYCWLHKAAFGCSEKLVKGQKTDGHITYVMRYVDMLMYNDIKPVLVFDGRNLPSKALTESKRRENRAKFRKMAKDYLLAGQDREARECFQRCIDITPAMAREVIDACRERNIDCIVAPYEADAQLAYLNKAGIVDLVISEDSDLTLFGCDRILFKLDSSGNGSLVEMAKLNACLGVKADNFTHQKFRHMCIMSGCDYLASLPGIGLGKAFKFWARVTNPDIRAVLKKIPSYLNMHQLTVTQEYIDGFIQADLTFLYQVVFDPHARKLRPLNDYQDDVRDLSSLDFAGEFLPNSLALDMAVGNIDLHTLARVGFNDPDAVEHVEKPRYGKRSVFTSIWDPSFDRANPRVVDIEERERRKRLDDSKAILNCFAAGPTKAAEKSPVFGQKRKARPEESESKDFLLAAPGNAKRRCTPAITKCFRRESEPSQASESLDESDSVAAGILDAYKRPEKAKVVKSRFFKPTSTPTSSQPMIHKQPKSDESESCSSISKPAKKSQRTSGDWFGQLDDSTPDKAKLVYRTHNMTGESKRDEGENESALKQAFKPATESSEAGEPNSSTRNPFAVKTPVKRPPSFEMKSPFKSPGKTLQIDLGRDGELESKRPVKSESTKRTSGDWFDKLDDSTPDKGQFVYRTHNMADKGKHGDSESDSVLKQAFKPVCEPADKGGTNSCKRNPFAVTTPVKRPPSFEMKSPFKSPRAKVPLEIDESQISISAALNPAQSPLKTSPIQNTVIRAASTCSNPDDGKKSRVASKADSENLSNSSIYFAKNQSGSAKRPKGVSGLLKRNTVKKQINLLDLWGKPK